MNSCAMERTSMEKKDRRKREKASERLFKDKKILKSSKNALDTSLWYNEYKI